MLSAHAGWNGERTRGASALEDWADVIITLTRDDEDDRYLRAMGRDVEIEEDRLSFDPVTRRLTLSGEGSRKMAAATARERDSEARVVTALREYPGSSASAILRLLNEEGEGVRRHDRPSLPRLVRQRARRPPVTRARGAKHYTAAGVSPPVPDPDERPPVPEGVPPVPSPKGSGTGRTQVDSVFRTCLGTPGNRWEKRAADAVPRRSEPEPWNYARQPDCSTILLLADQLKRGYCLLHAPRDTA